MNAIQWIRNCAACFAMLFLAFALAESVDLIRELKTETVARRQLWGDASVAALAIPATLDQRSKAVADAILPALKNISAVSDETYNEQKAAALTVNAAAKEAYDLLFDLHAAVNGSTDSTGRKRPDTFTALSVSLSELSALLAAAASKVEALPVEETAYAVTAVTRAVDESRPLVAADLRALESALLRLDTLLADPNISKTVAHVERSSETVAIVLEPLRKKANQVLAVLKFILARFTLPVP